MKTGRGVPHDQSGRACNVTVTVDAHFGRIVSRGGEILPGTARNGHESPWHGGCAVMHTAPGHRADTAVPDPAPTRTSLPCR